MIEDIVQEIDDKYIEEYMEYVQSNTVRHKNVRRMIFSGATAVAAIVVIAAGIIGIRHIGHNGQGPQTIIPEVVTQSQTGTPTQSPTDALIESGHWTECIYVVSGNNWYIVINNNEPVIITDTDSREILSVYQDGDALRVYISDVMETYPAQTKIYDAKLISHGDSANIRDNIISPMESAWD